MAEVRTKNAEKSESGFDSVCSKLYVPYASDEMHNQPIKLQRLHLLPTNLEALSLSRAVNFCQSIRNLKFKQGLNLLETRLSTLHEVNVLNGYFSDSLNRRVLRLVRP